MSYLCAMWGAETPPRAWGRPAIEDAERFWLRNTPTCVGKTTKSPFTPSCEPETPPRAWGRPWRISQSAVRRRNTPTCVGKTSFATTVSEASRKHPHVRGEDRLCLTPSSGPGETPPRAWGRRESGEVWDSSCRNTPTCVGKTWCDRINAHDAWKHPHVRGEDTNILSKSINSTTISANYDSFRVSIISCNPLSSIIGFLTSPL